MSIRGLLIVVAMALMVTGGVRAQELEDDPRMDWWREARFGMFIHWGLYSVPGGEWKGQTNHAEWIRTTAQIPIHEYEKFVGQFNPVDFDADEWVRAAKDAGMKYIVITTKHHDGFCLFDSKQTDFDVMSTPFKRDIMAEMAAACRKQGLKICWYHSIMDWHHPDYLPRRGWEAGDRPAGDADMDRYVEYLRAEVTELLSKYGPIGIMWFDGEWEPTWNHERGQALYDLCRSLQPDVIVNNRVDVGRGGMGGMSDAGFAGDYGTPEQEIPATGLPGVDWETCMTMNDHWGWNKHDNNWKSSRELIRLLVDVASKGGNYLLNVGPMPDGRFPPASVERLRDIGRWMRVNGDAIYGTHASPFEKLTWGRCTQKPDGGDTILYLHVFDWPADGKLVAPGIGNEARGAKLLADSGADLKVERRMADLVISLPDEMPDEDCSVVALRVVGKPIVYRTPRIVAASTKIVRSRMVTLESGSPELELRYTLDGSDPDASAEPYAGPFAVDRACVVKARAFHEGRPVSGVASEQFERVEVRPAVVAERLEPGLLCEVFGGDWDRMPDFSTMKPESAEVVESIALPANEAREHIGRRYRGYLRASADDIYVFTLTSDDGGRLFIGDDLVVDNDGLHSAATKAGEIALAAGTHPITVEWFNKTGNVALELRCAPAGEEPAVFRPEVLFHAP